MSADVHAQREMHQATELTKAQWQHARKLAQELDPNWDMPMVGALAVMLAVNAARVGGQPRQ